MSQATGRHPCPVCRDGQLEPFLLLRDVPVLSTEFHATRAAALDAPRGDLDLAVCRRCSLVWNTAFDASLVDYTPDYENSQHFSPAFQDYVADLAKRLTDRYGLHGRTLVDIGCGKGEFLALLAATANGRGVGFDPTFDGEVDDDRVEVVREYYDQESARGLDPALVMARHVVEHLANPVQFLGDVRAASGDGTTFYYEVPNAEYVFSDDGMWDLIYQHVGYFSQPSLDMALRAAGHCVLRLAEAFHGQFLGIEAVSAADPDTASPSPDDPAVDAAVARIETFAKRHAARLDRWHEALAAAGSGEVAVWGAGAKGVAFLNLLPDPEVVDHVIDLNPRKAGRFIPGTGQSIAMPDHLAGRPVERVLIMNPAYELEIREELRRQGVAAPAEIV